MRVRVISESQFTVVGHGVHTAFLEHVEYLKHCDDVQLDVNGRPTRASELVHIHTVGPYALTQLFVTRGLRIVTAHLLPDSLTGSVVGASSLKPLASRYFSWFYDQADIVIAVSDHVKSTLLDLGVKKPIFVLRNSIDIKSVAKAKSKREEVRRNLNLKHEDTLVVSVGQLQPRKGVFEFLRCAEQMPDTRFVWIGAPIFGAASSMRTELYRAIASAPKNFSYTGLISRVEVFAYLNSADIFVSLSRQETFGTAALEAAAAALPLVLSDLPPFRDTYGDAARFTKPNNAVSIISDFIRDPQARAVWGERAKRVALTHDRTLLGDSLLALYEACLNQSCDFVSLE